MLSTHSTHRLLSFYKIFMSFQKLSPVKSSSVSLRKAYSASDDLFGQSGLDLECLDCQNEKFVFNVAIESYQTFWNIWRLKINKNF